MNNNIHTSTQGIVNAHAVPFSMMTILDLMVAALIMSNNNSFNLFALDQVQCRYRSCYYFKVHKRKMKKKHIFVYFKVTISLIFPMCVLSKLLQSIGSHKNCLKTSLKRQCKNHLYAIDVCMYLLASVLPENVRLNDFF